MKLKTLVTILLLLFVGATVSFLVFKETRHTAVAEPPTLSAESDKNLSDVGSTKDKTTKPATLNQNAKVQNSPGEISEPKVVVYYFHGNTRCATCRMIEALSRVAVASGFPDEMKNNRVEFRAINVEEPINEHFVQDYRLVTRSVVLARFSGEKQEKWKNLDRVWKLVNNTEAFERYVQNETKNFLEGS